MSEKLILEPKEIGSFLAYISSVFAVHMEKKAKKTQDKASYIEAAIMLGVILAKRRPELVDACIQYASFTRTETLDDNLDRALRVYREAVDRQK